MSSCRDVQFILAVCSELGLSGWQLFDPNDLEVGGDVM